MKNAFYFKAVLVLKIFKFCLEFLAMQQNGLIRKIRLISNFMTSQPGKQTIVIHILSNISRSKGSQTVKFGQLIERNTRSIFLEKSYTKYGGETSPRLFSGKLKLSISQNQQSRLLQFVFSVCQVEGHRNILKLICESLAFTFYTSFFKKIKRGLELVSLASFCA